MERHPANRRFREAGYCDSFMNELPATAKGNCPSARRNVRSAFRSYKRASSCLSSSPRRASIVAAVMASAIAFRWTPTTAATDAADKAAVKEATAKCRAQVKEQAHFQEMSLYARHKLVKNQALRRTDRPEPDRLRAKSFPVAPRV